ncbi:MAG: pH regulation protein F [Hyphomicrobiales bacterium]|nr:pH regulation protein F [Hyphomicrobiales bacterium]
MFLAVSIAIMIVMVLALVRAFLGPTLFDRILAVNMFGTKIVLLVAVLGVVSDQSSFVDIALVYALINFIAMIAVLRFFEYERRTRERESS